MNESLKVQPRHLQRCAYLYIRQSSMKQVIENVESTKRQYALRGRATALGWSEDRIIVIDSDQGGPARRPRGERASGGWSQTSASARRESSWGSRSLGWQE